MQTYIVLNNYCIENIYFLSPQTNKILQKSKYIKFIYSNELISLNGIFYTIHIPIKHITNKYNKYKITFNPEDIQKYNNIFKFEENILNKYSKTKIKELNLKQLMEYGQCTFYSNFPIDLSIKTIPLLLKISGIWENQINIGLSYKITNINHQLSQNNY